jgi:hypothetical protein
MLAGASPATAAPLDYPIGTPEVRKCWIDFSDNRPKEDLPTCEGEKQFKPEEITANLKATFCVNNEINQDICSEPVEIKKAEECASINPADVKAGFDVKKLVGCTVRARISNRVTRSPGRCAAEPSKCGRNGSTIDWGDGQSQTIAFGDIYPVCFKNGRPVITLNEIIETTTRNSVVLRVTSATTQDALDAAVNNWNADYNQNFPISTGVNCNGYPYETGNGYLSVDRGTLSVTIFKTPS